MPIVVTCMIWFWMLNDMRGLVNAVLIETGLMKRSVAWFADRRTALLSLIFVHTWIGTPFFGINFLAAMQAIPRVLYEAAEVDGASVWRRFAHITLPGLRNVMVVVTLLSLIWTFNEFQIIWLLTRGGPGNSTQVFATLTYIIGIRSMRLGLGSAVSLVIFPPLAVIIMILVKVLGRVK